MKINLFGAGGHGQEYIKILNAKKCFYNVITQTDSKHELIKNEYNKTPFLIDNLNSSEAKDSICILSTHHDQNIEVLKKILPMKPKVVISEKPCFISENQKQEILDLLARHQFNKDLFFINYNRRFFDSYMKLKLHIIEQNFENFTVKIDISEPLIRLLGTVQDQQILDKWPWLNSCHLVDLASDLIGEELILKKRITTESASWAKFSGLGCSIFHTNDNKKKLVINYDFNNEGIWNFSLHTSSKIFYLNPVEKLTIKNNLKIEYEEEFKPKLLKYGLEQGINEIIKQDYSNFCSIEQQIRTNKIINETFI